MLRVVFLAVSLVFFSSCATITKGSKQLVTINCNVDGASVYLDGAEIGVTPFVGKIKKGKKMLMVKMQGYKTYSAALSSSLEGMFWGNIIIGGTLGSSTDFATGAAWAYAPASYQVELIPEGTSLKDFEKIINLKKFAMINISNISADLSNQDGEYLNSLMQLAQLKNSPENIDLVKNILIKSNGDQIAFGKLMVELLNI